MKIRMIREENQHRLSLNSALLIPPQLKPKPPLGCCFDLEWLGCPQSRFVSTEEQKFVPQPILQPRRSFLWGVVGVLERVGPREAHKGGQAGTCHSKPSQGCGFLRAGHGVGISHSFLCLGVPPWTHERLWSDPAHPSPVPGVCSPLF